MHNFTLYGLELRAELPGKPEPGVLALEVNATNLVAVFTTRGDYRVRRGVSPLSR